MAWLIYWFLFFSDVAINCTSLRVTEQEALQAIRNWLKHRKDKKKNAQNAPSPQCPSLTDFDWLATNQNLFTPHLSPHDLFSIV